MNAPKGEETIFAEALRLPPEERAAYLDQSTNGNAELRQRVESLLGSYEAGDFLEQAAATQFRKPLTITVPITEKPGETIGRYKLLQQIGEGGCGVVYMAEQAEPVRRRVALKIIKLGMDTKSVIARFEAERQALALMEHPNIAKVFDAGTTETGRPFFVMELVRGMKITDYCDEAKLSTRARLDLFIQVCQAIQHAHQKGIIHRDIKPSNILVTVNDGVPVPKVIDFGIAKATSGQQLTDKTLFTAFEQFIGTPAYMSPEQAVLTSLDIDTRSDIYALGVFLYEMLTGKTPFDAKELLAIGLDEMRRTIREQEPPRPSTRLSTLSGQELSTTAQRRGLDAPKLVTELRGDLDWIVMKALEKDRARRYETANGLAADIQRHLNNEPVAACPPSRLYRFQKMVRRNKLAFVAGTAVAASLIIGLTLSTVLFFRERAARKRASEQEMIAQAVNDFLRKDLLLQASSYEQAKSGFKPDPNLTVRQAVDRAAQRISDRFKNLPHQELAVRYTIGQTLLDLGDSERAIPHLLRCLELAREEFGSNHINTLPSMNLLAIAYRTSGKVDQALPIFEESLKLKKSSLGPTNFSTVTTMNNLANAYGDAGQHDRAIPLHEEVLKLRQTSLGPEHRETLNAMNNLAYAYLRGGRIDQALPLFAQTLKLMKARLGPDDPDTQGAVINLARGYRDIGKLKEALPLFEEVLKLRRDTLGPNHPHTQTAMAALAGAYGRAGKLDQALPLYEETLKLREAKLGPNHPDTLTAMVCLADVRARRGQFAEATAVLTKAKSAQPADHEVWHQLAALLVASGQLDAYRENCAKSVERFGQSSNLLTLERIAKDCLILPSSGADLGVVAKMVDTVAAVTNHWASPWFQFVKGLAEYRQGRLARAVELLNKVRTETGEAGERDVEAYMVLAMAHYQLKQTDEALTAFASGAEIERTDLPKLESGDIGGGWLDWIIAHALMREAKELIEGDASASAMLKDLGDSRELKAVRLKKAEALRAAAEKGDGNALNRLAWFLATCSDSAIRDGRSAVGYAEKAVAKTERKNPGVLDTLAAAYAEAGEFAKAADVQREAIGLCQAERTKNDLTARLKLYESNTPYRE